MSPLTDRLTKSLPIDTACVARSDLGASLMARVVALRGCAYVWVGEASSGGGGGDAAGEQGALVAAVKTPYEAMPTVTELLGEVSGAQRMRPTCLLHCSSVAQAARLVVQSHMSGTVACCRQSGATPRAVAVYLHTCSDLRTIATLPCCAGHDRTAGWAPAWRSG
jgi:hypothetical protein